VCTYKYIDLEDDQCDGKGTREMMRGSSKFDVCGTNATIYTKVDPIEAGMICPSTK